MMRSDEYTSMGSNVVLQAAEDPSHPLYVNVTLPGKKDNQPDGDFKADNGTCYKIADITSGFAIGEIYGLAYWQNEDDADF